MKKKIPETELILNPDGSIYHLRLHPEDIADTVIVAGDPERVSSISRHFDSVEFKMQNREFVTHTGTIRKKRVTVLSTGIGTDNIDIVLNELDALVNIDLVSREVKKEKRTLDIIRIGTSGALQADILPDSVVVSSHGLGFDGLLNYYSGTEAVLARDISESFIRHTSWNAVLPYPYVVAGSSELIAKVGTGFISGITATAPGFYGPQGRELRLRPLIPDLNERLGDFRFGDLRITNFEMETSALYGLSSLLGHRACTVCLVIANRVIKKYSKNYHTRMDQLIRTILDRLTA